MITFPKIKAAGYAIGKRLQGYHLLQNPKGTPQTEVNMIKENFYGTTAQWDDVFHITRLKRNFAQDEHSSDTPDRRTASFRRRMRSRGCRLSFHTDM